ncbi:hypothetical protein Syun_009438 [Stephania yunnanensis]|uniref:Uncharacterized protein n=1 Tax=Stephania yunnanensis TaxID=152371 RepID=A0AAP0KGD7_9MAGN
MDPEQTFIRVQERFSQILSPRVRTALEYVYLVVAIALFCVLVVMHANYVQQPGCSSELYVVRSSEAQLAHIKEKPSCLDYLKGKGKLDDITSIAAQSHNSVESTVEDIGDALPVANDIEVPNVDGDGFAVLGTKFWLNWIGSGARRSKLVFKALKTDNVELQPESSADISNSKAINNEKESDDGTVVQHGILLISARKSFKAAVVQFCSKCHLHFSFFIGRARQLLVSFYNGLKKLQKWVAKAKGGVQISLPLSLTPIMTQIETQTSSPIPHKRFEVQHVAGANMYLKMPWWVHLCRLDKINSFADIVISLDTVESVLRPILKRETKKMSRTVEGLGNNMSVKRDERNRCGESKNSRHEVSWSGYFLLPEGAKTQHGIRTVNISISARHSCFGNRSRVFNTFGSLEELNFQIRQLRWCCSTLPSHLDVCLHCYRKVGRAHHDRAVAAWQQLLINRFVGYDTILMNSLLSSPGQGEVVAVASAAATVALDSDAIVALEVISYIYNYQTKEFYDLSYAHEPTEVNTRFGDYLVTKCGVLIMSLFVFFTTTMSVSFTLRETQTRMLKFTGFSYLAFAAAAVFMQHLILYFWNRFEGMELSQRRVLHHNTVGIAPCRHGVPHLCMPLHLALFGVAPSERQVPALQRLMQSRRSQFPQPDIHITSSTILASTLHITRLNMRNPTPVNPGSPSGPGMRSVFNQAALPNSPADVPGGQEASDTISHGGTGTPDQFPELPQRSPTEAAQNHNSLNSFGSLLLWILGGASSEGLNSFLSLFRDARDEDQVYPESLQYEGPGT